MFFEDARDLTRPAIELLESQKDALGCPNLKVWAPADFNDYAAAHPLTREEKETIVDQAAFLLDQFYAHLPYKRARYASDPVQSLRVIRARIDELSDLGFHEQILHAMVSLRDAHTFYSLPQPYCGAFAFLPFEMDCFYQKTGDRRFIVTKVMDGFDHGLFTVNSEISSWNGLPIDQAVELEGLDDFGGNAASRLARSINRMCYRSLALAAPPKGSFVIVGYVPPNVDDEFGIVMPWHICSNGIASAQQQDNASSVNETMAQASRAARVLFNRNLATPDAGNLICQHTDGAMMPGGIDPADLHDPAHPNQKFGYIRIKSFECEATAFVEQFQGVVTQMQQVAPDGLIIDVRSNPGGSIQAAERILQFLTAFSIRPAPFHLLSSRTTQHIAEILQQATLEGTLEAHQREWEPWIQDLLNSITSGSPVTAGRPMTSDDDANDTGQIYQGPVTLIIDALAYSATDIFAAGFQDHQIGKIIGVDANTGGGGANRWLHEELMQNLKLQGLEDLPLQTLPGGAEMGLAVRRCSRVGGNDGAAIEDVGVQADIRYYVSRADLLNNDCELLAFACSQLGAQPTYKLNIDKAEVKADGFEVAVTTHNLFRLECVVNGLYHQCSVAVRDGQRTFHVPAEGLLDAPQLLQINGFAQIENEVGIVELVLKVTQSRVFADATSPVSDATAAAAG